VVARLLGVTLGVLFVAAVVVYGVFGANVWRWGCPSDEELSRPRTVAEVRDAFAREGLALEELEWPSELRRARRYIGATVLRREAPDVTLTIVVCKAHCEVPSSQLRPGRPRQRLRFGFSTTNVAGWIAGNDRQADAELRDPLSRAIDGLGTTVDPDNRCYIG
jgi:hypothetical protein